MEQKKYWRGLEEYHQTEAFKETAANEFQEDLPFAEDESFLSTATPRRDFLKYLGFSTLAATVAASCEIPVRKAIPYAIKPENITPGVPNYYASTFVDGGDYCPVVVKTRDGRPIKVEGNSLSSITAGSTSARVQASVLSLYDVTRTRFPMIDGKEATWEALDKMVGEAMAGLGGAPVVLLTASILSPTTKEVISQFLAKYPGSKHVTYDGVSYSGMLQANEMSYGKRAIPAYHFENAKCVVSIGADFLGTWLSPVEFSKGYSATRKVSAKNPVMSRHYQVEGHMSMTGANADVRVTCKPSEYGAVAAALYNALNGTAPAFASKKLNETITKAAADLKANQGAGLVVSGSNDPNVQVIVNAINAAIGANGTTLNWATPLNYKTGVDAEMQQLVADMTAGRVGALLMHGVNPVYDYYNGKFAEAMKNVKVTVSFSDRSDETTEKAKFVAPDNHWLESWGDAEPKAGFISFMQPTIAPLFKTRTFQDSLLSWSGNTVTYGDYFKQYWATKLGGNSNFDKVLQDGLIEPATPAMAGASFTGNVAAAITAATAAKVEGMEIVIYQKVAIGQGGIWSNNPWLQEMPDPITRTTWDNYVMMSPVTAKKMGAELTDLNEVDPNKKIFTITANGVTMELPVMVVPGMHNDVVAVAVGYGRGKAAGRAAADLGVNVFPFVSFDANTNTFRYDAKAEVKATDKTYALAQTQTHSSYEGRHHIMREFTLAGFQKDPNALVNERMEEFEPYTRDWANAGKEEAGAGHGGEHGAEHGGEHGGAEKAAAAAALANGKNWEEDYRKHGTMYPNYEAEGAKWGMSIDLNLCHGCGACAIACQAENNVSVVGKEQVLKAHEMHWLRIDRYFSGNPEDADSIETVFQPMLCQHCDNAPCENVCPVNATNHSNEGINQMAYNRCIGTRYCANNCPFKVRRFNWRDWNGADSFADNSYEDGRRDDINDNLTRMVLNPDVVVRSRGVMEKCSFCVQRLQEGKLNAKRENRPLQDSDVKVACQQACGTDAIVFGNVNDKNSEIYKVRNQDQKERVFYVLEQIHVLPNINYLAKVRNTDHIANDRYSNEHGAEHHGGEAKHEEKAHA
jgi:molybdopterin-containing oxidoreductase family iron-sulfur binding subunit